MTDQQGHSMSVGIKKDSLIEDPLFFNALPSTTVPTDLGDATAVDVSDSMARAIGLLPATAQSSDSAARIAFNSNFTFNALAGKEWQLGKRTQLNASGKLTYAGGRRHTPIDTALSRMYGAAVYNWDKTYGVRYPDYLKVDVRLGIKLDSKKVTQE